MRQWEQRTEYSAVSEGLGESCVWVRVGWVYQVLGVVWVGWEVGLGWSATATIFS